MITEVTVPTVGESITEGIIAEWKVKDGDYVRMDDPLFELETDKITMAMTAKAAGRISLKAEKGATVKIGQAVATIDTDAKAEAGIRPAGRTAVGEGDGRKPITKDTAPPQTEGIKINAPAGLEQMREKLAPAVDLDALSPAVRRLVAEHSLDPRVITGTGKGGRLTKEDVVRFISSQTLLPTQPTLSSPPRLRGGERGGALPPEDEVATARRVLAEVHPILEQIKQAVVESKPTPPMSPPAIAGGEGAVIPAIAGGVGEAPRQTRTPMSSLRARIAERMVLSQQTTATLTTFNEVDMTILLALRARFQEPFTRKYGVKLGIMPFFLKAVVDALKMVPEVNAQIDGGDIVHNHYYDIAVAVSTERGLVAPVLRNADQLSFADIELAIADMGQRAQKRTLTLEELSGGVFTVSNGGVFGSLLSTPILNPPQSAILGMHGIKKRPVVVGSDDRIEARPMMYLALSYDHRVIDGRESVAFLKRVVECIENPERMMLEI